MAYTELLEKIQRELAWRPNAPVVSESVTMADLEDQDIEVPQTVLAAVSTLLAILKEQFPSICPVEAEQSMSLLKGEDAADEIGFENGFVVEMTMKPCDTKTLVQRKAVEGYVTVLMGVDPSVQNVTLVEVEGAPETPTAASYTLSLVFGYGNEVDIVEESLQECASNESCDCGCNESDMTAAERDALPLAGFVFPDRRAWPIHDVNRAKSAIQYMNMGRGKKSEYPTIRAAIAKKYPSLKDQLSESESSQLSVTQTQTDTPSTVDNPATFDVNVPALVQYHLSVQPAVDARDILTSLSEALMDLLPAQYMYGSTVNVNAVTGDGENANTTGDMDGVKFEMMVSVFEDSASIALIVPDMDSYVGMMIDFENIMGVTQGFVQHAVRAFSQRTYMYDELEIDVEAEEAAAEDESLA
jgi:hypothetical protein